MGGRGGRWSTGSFPHNEADEPQQAADIAAGKIPVPPPPGEATLVLASDMVGVDSFLEHLIEAAGGGDDFAGGDIDGGGGAGDPAEPAGRWNDWAQECLYARCQKCKFAGSPFFGIGIARGAQADRGAAQ